MGVLDEEAQGRVDLEIYTGSLGDVVNAIPSTIGALRRRAGFIDQGAAKLQDQPCRLIPFRKSGADQLQMEFGDGYVRFWDLDGSEAAPEVASPYGADDLGGIRFDQSNDVVYLTHKSRSIAPQAMARTAGAFADLEPLDLRNGPWKAENGDKALTIGATALVGGVTLEASGPVFTPEVVGERIRLRLADGQPSCASWTPSTDYKAYELTQSDGKLYVAQDSDRKSGTAAPIHTQGTVYDGNLYWTYQSDGGGVVEITYYVSPTSVNALVIDTLPGWIISSDKAKAENPSAIPFVATSRWAFSAFSARAGWPGDVALTDDDRIALSGSRSEPGVYHLTRVAGYGPDYLDFYPGQASGRVVDDDGIRKPVRAGADPIEWLVAAGPLMFGTTSREGVIMASTLEEPLTPSDCRARGLSAFGSSEVAPAVAHDGVMFVPRGNRGLNFIKIGEQGAQDADLSLFVEDLVGERIVGVVWAGQPDKVGYCWTAKGSLVSVTYQPRQNQFGWARHPLPGGFLVESASVVTDGDGRDVLWLSVFREKDGEPQRRIWSQAARWRTGDPLTGVIYLDGCKLYSGDPVATLGGLEHLAGETVRVFGNGGALIFDAVVNEDGEISTPSGGTLITACVGLRYLFAAESLPMDIGGPGETAGALQSVKAITVYLADTVEAEVSFAGGPVELDGGKPWATDPEPATLVFKCSVGGTTDRDARWRVQTDDCWPITLRAVRTMVNVND